MPQASGQAGKLTFPFFGTRAHQFAIHWRNAVVAIAAVFCVAPQAVAAPSSQSGERVLRMHNIHTKEDISIVYKRNGVFVPEAVEKLNHFMRDWRRNITIKIDPDLYDVIWSLHRELGSNAPINLICGHRSSATNEGLRRTRGGQARGSLHIVGKAADIQFPDVSIKQLRNSALILERGGVGYYPSSSIPFVHVDTGRIRHWPRMPRQELAILFPSGRSHHVPADGRPLTQRDFRVALASLQEKGGELPLALQRRMRSNTPSTVLASLTPEASSAAAPRAAVAEARPKAPAPVFASLTPSFGGSKGTAPEETQPKPVAKNSGEARPIVQVSNVPTSIRPDASIFTREVLENDPAPKAAADAADEPDYDEDEMADDQEYQPYPALPYMADTPVAQMDMTGPTDELTPAKVMYLIGETREMLHQQFQPGLQVAELYWARRFRGSAVNTALRRVDRDARQQAVKTAHATR